MDADQPPDDRRWRRLHVLVLLVLAALIGAFTLITKLFDERLPP
jgi:hypothetical protein